MLDYCGEEKFYPMDGDNDCYDAYTPNLSGVEFAKMYHKPSRIPKHFTPNHNYYDIWVSFDRIIERATCYSILKDNFWMNIPKKIVREIKNNEIFVYRPIFNKIYEKSVSLCSKQKESEMKDVLDKMSDEIRLDVTSKILTMLDVAIDSLGEIKPLDKLLLDRIDALKQKADELRGE